MNNDKLAEFLSKHKYNCENFNEEGNYDPNPYWLADEIVEFLNLQNVTKRFSWRSFWYGWIASALLGIITTFILNAW